MQASDLTDEDIGHYFWVQPALGTDWIRICYHGSFAQRPKTLSTGSQARNGGPGYFVVLLCAPEAGVQAFRTPAGKQVTGVLVRSSSEIWPVSVIFAVDELGNVLELGEEAV